MFSCTCGVTIRGSATREQGGVPIVFAARVQDGAPRGGIPSAPAGLAPPLALHSTKVPKAGRLDVACR
jgi:hypothetical protein